GEESLDMFMVEMFGAVQTYEFAEEGTLLLLRWAEDGPVDYFRRVEAVTLPAPEEDGVATGTVIAPDGIFLRRGPGTNYPAVGAVPVDTTGRILGVNDTGEWWLALAPNLPGGQVWVAAQFVSVTNAQNVPVVTAPALGETLVNVPWEWVSTTDGAGVTTVPNPENYVIIFNTNDTAAIKADCNAVQATYTADANTVSLTLGASTLVACEPDSLGDLFVSQLSQVTSYFVEGGNLYLELPADSGTMRFVPQGTPLPTADAPAGEEAEGQRFYVTSFGGQPILPGTEITADFNNATVSGNAGCNNFSAPLLVADDGTFRIGPAAGTLQFCDEPEGVMEQEQAFLLALSSTQAYQWERSQMADGSFVTQGQFSYVLDDGTAGVINFTTSP
ncbi:MAG: META domain-containing protein, partial [Anaerolineales bacterium]|nr:META domain-containing protein [Anaerolineales bacterium]